MKDVCSLCLHKGDCEDESDHCEWCNDFVCKEHEFVESEVHEHCTVHVIKCETCGHESFSWRKNEGNK